MDGNAPGEDILDIDWSSDEETNIGNAEASLSTSATRSKLFDHFVGMGFPDKLVSKAIEENGEGNSEAILNSILTFSDGNAPGEHISDSDWSSDEQTNVGYAEASSSTSATRSKLFDHFVGMGFPDKLVSKAIEENGEENSDAILNSILTFSTLEESPPQQLSTSCSSDIETFANDPSDIDSWFEDEIETEDCLNGNGAYLSEKHKMLLSLRNGGSLSQREKKLLDLADMGYPLEVAETAMDRCGPEASVSDLTDFICAAQIARGEDYYFADDDLKPKHLLHGGSSNNKKRKLLEMKKNVIEECIRLPNPMIGYGIPSMPSEQVRPPLPEEARGPPFFYYENVALTPKGVWDTISRFLYNIEPEFVDSKFFCACARKRGYVHNLPIEGRFPLVPLPPLTVQQAFPLSKRWWPTWDPREKLNCIQTAIASAKLTERIRTALERYEGVPPEDVQRSVLEQCRKWNLVWVGKNKLAPLECDEVEMLLGFPRNHTRGGGISRTDRFKSLGNSFQVDTVAYHLSVLKNMYPEGINVLSLFSGIGGAEVALHRLGVKLKNVVSIEKTKGNRDIVKSWWEQTNQTGHLTDFEDVQQFDASTVEELVEKIGGFDLVVGGSPCNNLAGSNRVSRDGLEGKESSLFYDYFRILDLVRSVMRSRRR